MCEENVHTGQFDYLRLVAIFLKPDSSVSSTSEWTHRSGRARSVLCGSTGPTTSRLTLPRMTTPRCGTTRGSSVCLKEVLSKYGWGTSENEVEKREREADKRNMDSQDVKLLQTQLVTNFNRGWSRYQIGQVNVLDQGYISAGEVSLAQWEWRYQRNLSKTGRREKEQWVPVISTMSLKSEAKFTIRKWNDENGIK